VLTCVYTCQGATKQTGFVEEKEVEVGGEGSGEGVSVTRAGGVKKLFSSEFWMQCAVSDESSVAQ